LSVGGAGGLIRGAAIEGACVREQQCQPRARREAGRGNPRAVALGPSLEAHPRFFFVFFFWYKQKTSHLIQVFSDLMGAVHVGSFDSLSAPFSAQPSPVYLLPDITLGGMCKSIILLAPVRRKFGCKFILTTEIMHFLFLVFISFLLFFVFEYK
jgi:hypothetical protein